MARILVVDDEDELREVVVEELADEGHSTVGASGGQNGLDVLAKEPIDLIISDITMPQMNGYQFFRSVRERFPQHAQTPFIFLTALSDRDSEFKGLRLGVDDYITKPIDFDLMLLRIEAHLRRRQAMAGASSHHAPSVEEQPDPSDYRSEPGSGADLKSMLRENGGRVMASRFVTISMDDVRERVGERWSEVCDQILQNSELVIRAHLGPKDILSTTPSDDFIVCFAGLDEEELAAKTSLIRDEIWERLFALVEDEALCAVDAQSHALSLDPDKIDEEVIFVEADKAITNSNEKDVRQKKSQLEKIYSFEELYAYPILNTKGVPSKIKSLSFDRRIEQRVRNLSAVGQYDPHFFLDLKKKIFERLRDRPNLNKAFANHAMLLSVEFDLLRDQGIRSELTSLCQDLERSLNLILIIEVVGTPDRLKPNMDRLTPLPVGRKLQFIELRRPAQADGVALDQLGVAYVSMSFGNVVASPKKAHVDFVKTLESQGVKLYIKDIPEGKLFEAQNLQGQLFSMMK